MVTQATTRQPSQSIAKEGRGSFSGDVVLDNLEMGTGQGFKHVAKYWLENGCKSFAEARAVLADDQQKIKDFLEPLERWECIATPTGIAFYHCTDGRMYTPTDHALNLMCQVGRGMSSWMVRSMVNPIPHATKKDGDGESVPIEGGDRTLADYECLRDYVNLHLFNPDRVDQKKTRLFRTWSDGTFRALLSEQYTIVNNSWYLGVLEKAIPGGVVSHWQGDADSMFGNILIPDTIRAESDSDFGGMFSVGNSEIGTRRISGLPSVFRAICMNGCIWNQEMGKGINKVHRGAVDFLDLEKLIIKNLEDQIPLLPMGIERILGLRAFGCGDTPLSNLLAQTAIDYSLSKRQVSAVEQGWQEEIRLLGINDAKTAYGLTNAITRAGQTLGNNDQWVRFDAIGGEFVNLDRNGWNKFRSRADGLTTPQVEKRLGMEVAA
jgi:hypothetical protein